MVKKKGKTYNYNAGYREVIDKKGIKMIRIGDKDRFIEFHRNRKRVIKGIIKRKEYAKEKEN